MTDVREAAVNVSLGETDVSYVENADLIRVGPEQPLSEAYEAILSDRLPTGFLSQANGVIVAVL
jgi:hypothetical protein